MCFIHLIFNLIEPLNFNVLDLRFYENILRKKCIKSNDDFFFLVQKAFFHILLKLKTLGVNPVESK